MCLAVRLQEEALQTETARNLYSDSDVHSSEYEDISAQSDRDTSNITDTNFTHWTDNTNCQPTLPVVHKFIGGPIGL